MQESFGNEARNFERHVNKSTCEGRSPKYRMVALDLDGTLLRPDHEVSDATVDYLQTLNDKGFIVSIATGRSPASTVSVIHSLGLKGGKPFGFPLVCLNGARGMEIRPSGMKYPLHDNAAQTTPTGDVSPTEVVGSLRFVELFHEPIPRSVAVKALGLAKELRLVTNYYIGHEIHAQPKEESHFDLTQRYTELTGTQIVHCDDDYGALLKQGLPSKLVVLCDSSELDCVCSKLKEALEGQANVVRGSPPFFVEVLNKDVNKGRGLELMCKRLGVTPEEAIAFGDGDNDKEFLGVAGRGIAMKNARDAVKEVADEVTEWTNAQDGVMRTLQRMENEGLLCFP